MLPALVQEEPSPDALSCPPEEPPGVHEKTTPGTLRVVFSELLSVRLVKGELDEFPSLHHRPLTLYAIFFEFL